VSAFRLLLPTAALARWQTRQAGEGRAVAARDGVNHSAREPRCGAGLRDARQGAAITVDAPVTAAKSVALPAVTVIAWVPASRHAEELYRDCRAGYGRRRIKGNPRCWPVPMQPRQRRCGDQYSGIGLRSYPGVRVSDTKRGRRRQRTASNGAFTGAAMPQC
jgi:hypothetical protein